MAHQGLMREWVAPFPVDVRLTLSAHGRGLGDPTYQVDGVGAVWRTSLTPDGPGTIRVLPATRAEPGPAARAEVNSTEYAEPGSRAHFVSGPATQIEWDPTAYGEQGPQAPTDLATGSRVVAYAWGSGGKWLLESLPAILGLYDDISGFDPTSHPVLRQVAKRHPGFRLGRSGRLMEALVPAILEQKVVSLEAHRAWKILLNRYGTPPPGSAPRGMRVFPPPKIWRLIPSWEWHKAGVEGVRAQTIIRAATVAATLERLLDPVGETRAEEAGRKLRTIPGIGPWTSAETLQRAAGDPDAVSVGDYNLPKAVGYALAGRETTDDEQMLELLEPYKGHRHRVGRLVELSGLSPPRRGPRMSVRDYRSF